MEFKMKTKGFPMLMIIFTSLYNSQAFDELKESGHDDNLSQSTFHEVLVGVILDMSSEKGKIIHNHISVAISDFYKIHGSYKTRLVFHLRDSKAEPVYSAAFDLLQKTKVTAIIGAQTHWEAKLLAELGSKYKVPVLSFSPLYTKTPYFVQVTDNDFKSYSSEALVSRLVQRWRKKGGSHEPNAGLNKLGEVGSSAYDVVWCLAKAAEKVHIDFALNKNAISKHVSLFLKKTQRRAIFMDTKLRSNIALEVEKRKVEDSITNRRHLTSSTENDGATTFKASVKKLRIGLPISSGFPELLNVQYDSQTSEAKVSGFCIDVFQAAAEILPYQLQYEFIPVNSSYDDLIYQVYLEKFDGAVGDLTIMASRFLFVDFTLPFTNADIGMVGKKQNEKSKWVFLKPLTTDLWLSCVALFCFTGFVVWVIEKPRNDEFQGSLSQQIGAAFWFSFSTLFFAHRERLMSNLSRFVVIIWLFVVLVLTSSYTATLTSMLTLQQIQLNSKNMYIGYNSGSSTSAAINNLNIDKSRLKPLNSPEEYAEALPKGGVSSIIDEMPYIKLFLAKYGNHYSIIETVRQGIGLGFAFRKGSQRVEDMSRAIAILREDGKLSQMEEAMFASRLTFGDTKDKDNVSPLTLERFQGLFLISLLSSILCLFVFSMFVLRSKWPTFVTNYDRLIGQKLEHIKRYMSENINLRPAKENENNVVRPV